MQSKTLNIIIAVFIVVVALFVLTQINTSNTSDIIKIGVIIPLTGTSADAGNYVKAGVELAVQEINASSTKYRFEPIFEDSQYKNEIAVSAIQKLITLDKVRYVIGEYGSSQSLAIAPIAERNKIIMITPSTQADALSDSGDYIFRTQINVTQEVAYFVPIIFGRLGAKRLDVIALNTDYGVSYIDDFTKSYSSLGGNLGLVQKFNADNTDFRTLLLKVKQDNAKAVLLVGNRKMNATMLNQAKELGFSPAFFASSVTEGQEFVDIAKDNAEGLIYPYPYDETSTDSAQILFQNKYQTVYGKKSEMVSANSYDAIMLLNKCFESVGVDTDLIKDCLYDIKDYRGAGGILTFDSKGDVSKPFILKTVKDGQFVKYQ